ncbi:PLC-like phosphodiesterase [Bombardia bombarda]|uniref:Phosphoinositide phospholipase C n=1 Tax=Bombardia bombarda TaxID=252184 RepID=A0AA40CEB2_9PEZI|nr:PLC-like phosphodiesterase [Bombardia bombarda]
MSITTDSFHQKPSPSPSPPTKPLTMSEDIQSRRSRQSHFRTSLRLQSQVTLNSQVTLVDSQVTLVDSSDLMTASPDESPYWTPTLSPETIGTGITTSSSRQDSPEPLEPALARVSDDISSTDAPFQLPDSITSPIPICHPISRKTSTASLGQGILRSPGPTAMGDAMKSSSLIRRASNGMKKATGLFQQARRQSSTHPRSRDGSVGPGVIRGRRGSVSNGEQGSVIFGDSDDDCAIEKDDVNSFFGLDGPPRDFSPLNATASYTGSASTAAINAGPVIPLMLRQGTPLTKIGKKDARKRITMVLDSDSAKICWVKNRSSKSIYIDDIKEIRKAEDIRQYLLDSRLDESMEPRFFSIIYSVPDKANKVLHLVADSEDIFLSWTNTLDAISKHRQDFAASLMAFNDKAIRAYWQNEMAKKFGDKPRTPEEENIDFVGVERMCRSLHIHVPTQQLREKFDKVKARKTSCADLPSGPVYSSRLDFVEFLEFVRLMKARKDVRPVYRENTADMETGMTKAEFLHFLRHVQFENVDEDLTSWETIFARFARKGKLKDAERQASGGGEEGLTMSEAAFASFLTSTSNVIVAKEPQEYKLTRPINEYYISSSHNTYLLGRQVAGVSSVEGYISALMRGCRCVEVDCWDGENEREPVVMHGHTWTTRISFLEVIKTINKYAFLTHHYPLWISLEVRCSPATQATMAKMMIEVFGKKLVRTPLEPGSSQLPSPDELKDRILIKVKKSQPLEDSLKNGERFGRRRGNSLPSQYQRALSFESVPVPVPSSPLLSPTPLSRSNRQINTITEGQVHDTPSSSPSECESESEKDSAKKSNSKINPVLGDLGVYCTGINFEGFDTPEAKTYNHIFSFKERTFAEKSQSKEGKRALYRHNMKYLMRVYPNGSRISSNNFDPTMYWKRGVQMAALNWQTFDFGMQVNQAMFDSGTDQSGYVLKPVEQREIQRIANADEYLGKRPRKNVTFKIDIISAQQLMRPWNLGEKRTLDPYVEVEVFLADDKRNKPDAPADAPAQDTQLKWRTKIVRENGFNPEFNGSYTFNVTTKYPDLIFIRWSVKLADKSYNDRAPPLATFMAKLTGLKQGYRTKGPITSVMVACPEDTPKNGSSKLKSIGRTVFSQSNTGSPKSSTENIP